MNPKQQPDDFDDMTSQGSTMMVKGADAMKFDDMSSQGSYMIKGPRGLPDDISSKSSSMVRGNNRADDMSSQGSFMVKAGGVDQSERGTIMVKGGFDADDDSFVGSDEGGKAELDDTEIEAGQKPMG